MIPRAARSSISPAAVAQRADGEFVEEGVVDNIDAFDRAEPLGEVDRGGVIERRDAAQACLAKQRQVDREGERA